MQLDIFKSRENRDKGIKKALDNADSKIDKWSEKAYNFLIKYLENNRVFMAEDVRLASIGILEEPPHARAWGGIMTRARYDGLIERVGYQPVKNANANRTPATLWTRKKR